MLKTPLNELWPIWPLQILLSLEELIELKKIKHHYYMWKKYSRRDNEGVNEWNARAREISTQKNQNKIESFVEPYMTWFKPTTCKFNGKEIFEEYARGWVVSNSTRSSKQKVVCEQGDIVKDSREELGNSGNNSSKTTIHVKARSKGTFHSCFRGKKRGISNTMKKLTYHHKTFKRSSSMSMKKKFLDVTGRNCKSGSTLKEIT
jgi:hypothetical protein